MIGKRVQTFPPRDFGHGDDEFTATPEESMRQLWEDWRDSGAPLPDLAILEPWEREIALEVLDGGEDDVARVMETIEQALREFAVKHDPKKHPRWPKGTPGGLGGQFRSKASAAKLAKITGHTAEALLKDPSLATKKPAKPKPRPLRGWDGEVRLPMPPSDDEVKVAEAITGEAFPPDRPYLFPGGQSPAYQDALRAAARERVRKSLDLRYLEEGWQITPPPDRHGKGPAVTALATESSTAENMVAGYVSTDLLYLPDENWKIAREGQPDGRLITYDSRYADEWGNPLPAAETTMGIDALHERAKIAKASRDDGLPDVWIALTREEWNRMQAGDYFDPGPDVLDPSRFFPTPREALFLYSPLSDLRTPKNDEARPFVVRIATDPDAWRRLRDDPAHALKGAHVAEAHERRPTAARRLRWHATHPDKAPKDNPSYERLTSIDADGEHNRVPLDKFIGEGLMVEIYRDERDTVTLSRTGEAMLSAAVLRGERMALAHKQEGGTHDGMKDRAMRRTAAKFSMDDPDVDAFAETASVLVNWQQFDHGDTPEQKLAGKVVATWAHTSADSSTFQHYMQWCAAREFGLPLNHFIGGVGIGERERGLWNALTGAPDDGEDHTMNGGLMESLYKDLLAHPDKREAVERGARKVLRAMHQATQDDLAAIPGDDLLLIRGMSQVKERIEFGTIDLTPEPGNWRPGEGSQTGFLRLLGSRKATEAEREAIVRWAAKTNNYPPGVDDHVGLPGTPYYESDLARRRYFDMATGEIVTEMPVDDRQALQRLGYKRLATRQDIVKASDEIYNQSMARLGVDPIAWGGLDTLQQVEIGVELLKTWTAAPRAGGGLGFEGAANHLRGLAELGQDPSVPPLPVMNAVIDTTREILQEKDLELDASKEAVAADHLQEYADLLNRGVYPPRLTKSLTLAVEDTPDWLAVSREPHVVQSVRANPMSSHATSESAASGFEGEGGAFLVTVVPKTDIIGMPGAGYGCLNENEVVVLGRDRPTLVVPHQAYTGDALSAAKIIRTLDSPQGTPPPGPNETAPWRSITALPASGLDEDEIRGWWNTLPPQVKIKMGMDSPGGTVDLIGLSWWLRSVMATDETQEGIRLTVLPDGVVRNDSNRDAAQIQLPEGTTNLDPEALQAAMQALADEGLFTDLVGVHMVVAPKVTVRSLALEPVDLGVPNFSLAQALDNGEVDEDGVAQQITDAYGFDANKEEILWGIASHLKEGFGPDATIMAGIDHDPVSGKARIALWTDYDAGYRLSLSSKVHLQGPEWLQESLQDVVVALQANGFNIQTNMGAASTADEPIEWEPSSLGAVLDMAEQYGWGTGQVDIAEAIVATLPSIPGGAHVSLYALDSGEPVLRFAPVGIPDATVDVPLPPDFPSKGYEWIEEAIATVVADMQEQGYKVETTGLEITAFAERVASEGTIFPDADPVDADWPKRTWDIWGVNDGPSLDRHLASLNETPERFMSLPVFLWNVDSLPWLAEWAAQHGQRAFWDERLHPRYPKGYPGGLGGKWMPSGVVRFKKERPVDPRTHQPRPRGRPRKPRWGDLHATLGMGTRLWTVYQREQIWSHGRVIGEEPMSRYFLIHADSEEQIREAYPDATKVVFERDSKVLTGSRKPDPDDPDLEKDLIAELEAWAKEQGLDDDEDEEDEDDGLAYVRTEVERIRDAMGEPIDKNPAALSGTLVREALFASVLEPQVEEITEALKGRDSIRLELADALRIHGHADPPGQSSGLGDRLYERRDGKWWRKIERKTMSGEDASTWEGASRSNRMKPLTDAEFAREYRGALLRNLRLGPYADLPPVTDEDIVAWLGTDMWRDRTFRVRAGGEGHGLDSDTLAPGIYVCEPGGKFPDWHYYESADDLYGPGGLEQPGKEVYTAEQIAAGLREHWVEEIEAGRLHEIDVEADVALDKAVGRATPEAREFLTTGGAPGTRYQQQHEQIMEIGRVLDDALADNVRSPEMRALTDRLKALQDAKRQVDPSVEGTPGYDLRIAAIVQTETELADRLRRIDSTYPSRFQNEIKKAAERVRVSGDIDPPNSGGPAREVLVGMDAGDLYAKATETKEREVALQDAPSLPEILGSELFKARLHGDTRESGQIGEWALRWSGVTVTRVGEELTDEQIARLDGMIEWDFGGESRRQVAPDAESVGRMVDEMRKMLKEIGRKGLPSRDQHVALEYDRLRRLAEEHIKAVEAKFLKEHGTTLSQGGWVERQQLADRAQDSIQAGVRRRLAERHQDRLDAFEAAARQWYALDPPRAEDGRWAPGRVKKQVEQEIAEAQRDNIRRVLAAAGVGFGNEKIRLSFARRTAGITSVEEASGYLPNTWVRRANEEGVSLGVKLRRGERAQYEYDGTIKTDGRLDTSIHELTHHMEHTIPALGIAEWVFWQRRARGGNFGAERERLTRIYKTGKREVGVKDEFKNRYAGKVYNEGNPYAAWELLSMGMEAIWGYDNPDLLYEDTEYRRFVLGVLGAIR